MLALAAGVLFAADLVFLASRDPGCRRGLATVLANLQVVLVAFGVWWCSASGRAAA